MLFQVLGWTALGGSCVLAWRLGGFDERVAALCFVVATIASNLANQSNYGNTETGVLIIDLALLGCLVALALRSDRFWPMWASAFQLVGTTVHIASMAETGDFAWAYAVGLIFWSYPVMITLMVGTWLEGRFRDA